MDLQLEKEETFRGNAHTMLLLSPLVDAFSTWHHVLTPINNNSQHAQSSKKGLTSKQRYNSKSSTKFIKTKSNKHLSSSSLYNKPYMFEEY